MIMVIIYLIFGATLSGYVAGKFIPHGDRYGADYGPAIFFSVIGALTWPILVPALIAFRAGTNRKSS